ncbi:MAG: hypothetical protein LM514_02510 [Streptococcus sp.]|nr:hypothetical protein [Streptococcus sp.]
MLNNLPTTIANAASWIASKWPWFARKLNKIAINSSVNVCRHRPHPWSMVHPYVSWTSLTDKQWSARHLPEKKLSPPKSDVIELFRRKKLILCPKSTCLFPAFAQYLTDGFIRTKMPNKGEPDDPKRKQNTSNHEIDMSPLYGRNVQQTEALRVLSNVPGKKGKLKSQLIGNEEYGEFLYNADGQVKPEFRCLDLPLMSDRFLSNTEILSRIFAFGGDRANASPQIAMMNTLFLREHNRIAGLLETQNPEWDDQHVFEVARNIIIVLFIKIVVEEYINHISPSIKFIADPEVAWDAPWNKPNWITTEFSLLYRWHPLIPEEIVWGEKIYPVQNTIMNNEPLLTVGLRQAFIDMSAQRAGRIGPFNTAESLLPLEQIAINQGRLCKLASYGDYREYLSMNRPAKFSDISSDPAVIKLLSKAYQSVDDVEFYVGLFAEDLDSSSPLPPLIRTMVAVDAFSQALTNPLLSRHVFNEATFTTQGMKIITETSTLRDILNRNVAGGISKTDFIGMTRIN